MTFKYLLKFAIEKLKHNRKRSITTILALTLTFLTFSVLTSASFSLKEEIKKASSLLGSDIILILPVPQKEFSSSMAPAFSRILTSGLKESEINRLNVEGVERIAKASSSQGKISTPEKTFLSQISYIDREALTFLPFVTVEKGRLYRDNEKAVVLGRKIADDLNAKVGRTITINGEKVKVVGILKPTGSFFFSTDEAVFMPFSTLKDKRARVLIVKVSSTADVSQVAERLKEEIDRIFHSDEETRPLSVLSADALSQSFSRITSVTENIALVFSLVSAFVSFLVLSNALSMEVREDTRIIGTLRAIGAKKMTVVFLYLIQSLLYASISILFGLVVFLFLFLLASHFLPLHTSPLYLLGSILLILCTSVLSTIIPSKLSADISPAEAVRYE